MCSFAGSGGFDNYFKRKRGEREKGREKGEREEERGMKKEGKKKEKRRIGRGREELHTLSSLYPFMISGIKSSVSLASALEMITGSVGLYMRPNSATTAFSNASLRASMISLLSLALLLWLWWLVFSGSGHTFRTGLRTLPTPFAVMKGAAGEFRRALTSPMLGEARRQVPWWRERWRVSLYAEPEILKVWMGFLSRAGVLAAVVSVVAAAIAASEAPEPTGSAGSAALAALGPAGVASESVGAGLGAGSAAASWSAGTGPGLGTYLGPGVRALVGIGTSSTISCRSLTRAPSTPREFRARTTNSACLSLLNTIG